MGKKIQYLGRYVMDGVMLGKGNFARVELATHEIVAVKVAIKVIDTRKIKDEYVRSNLHREAGIMAKVRHPNIIRLYETLKATTLYCLVTEFAAGGDLLAHIKSQENSRLSEKEAIPFLRQLLSALLYLHDRGVVHRDLKMENVMLDAKKKNIKLIDFGLSNIYRGPDDPLHTHCGSPEYAAPELFVVNKTYGPEIDIWSFGIIMYAMLLGRLPFTTPYRDEYQRQRMLQQIQKGLSSYHDRDMQALTSDCRSLIHQLIEPNPELRIPLSEVSRHPWITRHGKNPFYPYQPPPKDKTIRHQAVMELSIMMGLKRKDVEETVKESKGDELSSMYNMLIDKKLRDKGIFDLDHTTRKQKRNRSAERERVQTPDSSRGLRTKGGIPKRALAIKTKAGMGSKARPKNRHIRLPDEDAGPETLHLHQPERYPCEEADFSDNSTPQHSNKPGLCHLGIPQTQYGSPVSTSAPSTSFATASRTDKSKDGPTANGPTRIPLSQRRQPPARLNLTLDLSVANSVPPVSKRKPLSTAEQASESTKDTSTGSCLGIAASSGVPPKLSPAGSEKKSSKIPVLSPSKRDKTDQPSPSKSGLDLRPLRPSTLQYALKAKFSKNLTSVLDSGVVHNRHTAMLISKFCQQTTSSPVASSHSSDEDDAQLMAPKATPEDSVIDSYSTGSDEDEFKLSCQVAPVVDELRLGRPGAPAVDVDDSKLSRQGHPTALTDDELSHQGAPAMDEGHSMQYNMLNVSGDETQEGLPPSVMMSSQAAGGDPAASRRNARWTRTCQFEECREQSEDNSCDAEPGWHIPMDDSSQCEPLWHPPLLECSRCSTNSFSEAVTEHDFGRDPVYSSDIDGTSERPSAEGRSVMDARRYLLQHVGVHTHSSLDYSTGGSGSQASVAHSPSHLPSYVSLAGHFRECIAVGSGSSLPSSLHPPGAFKSSPHPSPPRAPASTSYLLSQKGAHKGPRGLFLSLDTPDSLNTKPRTSCHICGLSPGSPTYYDSHSKFCHTGAHALDIFVSPDDLLSPSGPLWLPVASVLSQSSPTSGSAGHEDGLFSSSPLHSPHTMQQLGGHVDAEYDAEDEDTQYVAQARPSALQLTCPSPPHIPRRALPPPLSHQTLPAHATNKRTSPNKVKHKALTREKRFARQGIMVPVPDATQSLVTSSSSLSDADAASRLPGPPPHNSCRSNSPFIPATTESAAKTHSVLPTSDVQREEASSSKVVSSPAKSNTLEVSSGTAHPKLPSTSSNQTPSSLPCAKSRIPQPAGRLAKLPMFGLLKERNPSSSSSLPSTKKSHQTSKHEKLEAIVSRNNSTNSRETDAATKSSPQKDVKKNVPKDGHPKQHHSWRQGLSHWLRKTKPSTTNSNNNVASRKPIVSQNSNNTAPKGAKSRNAVIRDNAVKMTTMGNGSPEKKVKQLLTTSNSTAKKSIDWKLESSQRKCKEAEDEWRSASTAYHMTNSSQAKEYSYEVPPYDGLDMGSAWSETPSSSPSVMSRVRSKSPRVGWTTCGDCGNVETSDDQMAEKVASTRPEHFTIIRKTSVEEKPSSIPVSNNITSYSSHFQA